MLTRTTTDVVVVGDMVDLMVTWVAHAASVVFIVLLLMQMDVQLALVGLAFIPLLALLVGVVLRLYERRVVALREASAALTSVLHESVAGIRSWGWAATPNCWQTSPPTRRCGSGSG